jgi:hypothetical protein
MQIVEAHAGPRAQPVATAQEAQLADRGEGENGLEIGLPQGQGHPQHHGEEADREQQGGPEFGGTQDGKKARAQKYAQLHHGRGMQIGTHRRGSGHGIG